MNYTLVTLWKTLDGTYYSKTDNYGDYDSAIGNTHSKFKPLQNDSNVAYFTLYLMDELGNKVDGAKFTWTRPIAPTEEPTEEVASAE